MKFLSFLQKSVGNLYFGLFLKEEDGVGIIMQQEGASIRILDKEKFKYSNGWENLTEDVDDLLFKMEQRLKIHVKETILFVYSHLVDEKNGNIKQPYAAKVKDMLKQMELTPLGYIECFEAVVKFLEEQDETPLTAILVELDKNNLSIFIYKGGRIAHRIVSLRSDNLVDDLTSCFAQLNGRILLPAHIILYNSSDLDSESSRIVSHRWSEDYFVQIPRVEIVKENDVISGLIKIFEQQVLNQKQAMTSEKEAGGKEVLGFVVGEDIGEAKEEKFVETKLKFSSLKSLISSVSLPHITIPTIPRKVSIFLGIFLIILGLFLNEYFLHKATLTVFLPFQTVNQTLTIDVPLRSATVSADFAQSKPTTGVREIGDKAKGSITLYNFSDSGHSFSAGTILDADGIKFTLDQDASASASTIVLTGVGPVKSPGQVKVNVTAVDIGPQANLDKGHKLNVADFPQTTFLAMNGDAFKGGSKSQIRTVAKKDIDDLKSQVLNKAKSLKPDGAIIESLTQVNFRDTVFSSEIGSEADTISLKAKVDSTYFSYNKNQLADDIIAKVSPSLTSGFVLTRDKVDYTVTDLKQTGGGATLKLSVHAKAMKNVSEKSILEAVVGKNKSSLGSFLKNKFAVEGYEVVVKEPLPFLSNLMPFFKKNISLKIGSL